MVDFINFSPVIGRFKHIYFRMKKIVTIVGLAFFALCIVSCGGSKKTIKHSTGDVEIVLNRCEKLALEKPALRSHGVGIHFKEATAKNVAEAQASGEFRRKIARVIMSGTTDEGSGKSLFSADNTIGQGVTDQAGGMNDFVTSIAEGIVNDLAIIDMVKYMQPNNQYKIYVCLEYQKGGIPEMANEIAKKFQQKISDEDKLKIQFEFEQYRKRIEEELRKYKGE